MTGERTMVWRAGAFAALQRHPRKLPREGDSMLTGRASADWYKGFNEARARLAALEAELVRGEEPK